MNADGSRAITATDHRPPVSVAAARDQLEGDVAELAPEVLGDHEHAAHASLSFTISAILRATSAGFPSSISAPSGFDGTNMRRMW